VSHPVEALKSGKVIYKIPIKIMSMYFKSGCMLRSDVSNFVQKPIAKSYGCFGFLDKTEPSLKRLDSYS